MDFLRIPTDSLRIPTDSLQNAHRTSEETPPGALLPKVALDPYGFPTDSLRIPYGFPTDPLRIPGQVTDSRNLSWQCWLGWPGLLAWLAWAR